MRLNAWTRVNFLCAPTCCDSSPRRCRQAAHLIVLSAEPVKAVRPSAALDGSMQVMRAVWSPPNSSTPSFGSHPTRSAALRQDGNPILTTALAATQS